ncbi:class I SAM-dependent methyltransferase [Microlunatus soli]|uniref:Ubiquinone/menaquinone biosynthesis C-methylase UbiE n=1 Tax=Microlunatus soli TaxID=630515 RepID=A0A1H1M8S0_9ACTN|nr:class I SAM-dependent methyltransferase [Microlunatus soli]SDR83201.1 Ubiquinone/menaquinone biosynthesis C-methylase UbiE [Microlunatus soli]
MPRPPFWPKRPSKPSSAPAYVNASRVQLRRAMERFAAETPSGSRVLDAGAGTSPYRRLFRRHHYEASDFAQLPKKYAPLDYVCDITAIPTEDDRFDRVICNQVLEHVPEPAQAIRELYRVLKPGGLIFCSAPLFYAEHQRPYDFYRYTQFALRRLFTEAGFEIASIERLEGVFGTTAYQFQQMWLFLPRTVDDLRQLNVGGRIVYLAPFVLGTRWMAGHLRKLYSAAEVRWKYVGHGMPKNWVVIARKPNPVLDERATIRRRSADESGRS